LKRINMKSFFFLIVFISLLGHSQDPQRFADEVMAIQKKYDTLWDAKKETVVFTGSSSIRFWKTLESRFPDHQIVNTGFGGSEASDLLAFSNELIHRFEPKKVFIYEGDNDIYSKKKPKRILSDIQSIIGEIRVKNAKTKLILIAAKPSLSRWHLRRKYIQLNRKLKKLAKSDRLIEYADVWAPMMNGRKVKKDIFIADGLHMNSTGYQIWYDVIKNYIEN